MEELDIAAITRRSIHGVFALVSRTAVIQLVSFVASFLLTIFLSASDFGVFLVVQSIIAFLQYFSDIGLAGALIQKKEQITKEDLATTFTIQQILVISISIIVLILSPFIQTFYHLNTAGLYLMDAFVISFFLSSLKTIPSIILERNLRFEKLVIPQIVENLFFNIVLVICAVRGLGIMSFVYAVLIRGISGLIAMYSISPWRIQIGISKNVAKKLLSFGIPFQMNSFLALLKDDLLIAYIGKILPFTQVGYIGFAQKWAFTPLRLIMDNVIRITFPAFSRLQHSKEHLRTALEKSLFALTLLIFPALTGLIILMPSLLVIIPRWQNKWEPATLSLAFFAMNAALSSISTPLTNALNAIGKIKITLYLMIFWTVTTWILTPLFILAMGFNGFAFASAIIATSVVGVVAITKKYIQFSILPTFLSPLVGSVIMGICLYILRLTLPVSIFSVLFLILFGAAIYFATVFFLSREQVIEDMKLIKKHVKK